MRTQLSTPINIESISGFYAVYMTGSAGPGFALVCLNAGKIVGADATGVTLDGHYTTTADNKYLAKIKANTPENIQLIYGGFSGPEGETTELEFMLPMDFYSRDFVRIETPRGPMNARFAKLRGVDG